MVRIACFLLVVASVLLSSSSGLKEAPRRRSFGQLPTALFPIKYNLSIQPYFPADGITYPSVRNFTFDANLTITIRCLDDTDNITLHMLNLEVDSKKVQLAEKVSNLIAKSISVSQYSYDNGSQQIVFPAGSTLQAGRDYELSLAYRGLLDANALSGFYPSSYVENGKTKWLAVTQFEPTDARRVIPSFDEPFYKAPFEVTIIHPTSMVALSNSMENGTNPIGNGWSRTIFEPTVNMSTYLLAMAVCEFKSKESHTADNKTLFRVWARPSFIDRIDFALAAGPKVLDYYSEYFEIPFPLKKQDMIALPDFSAGAMENWGLVTYRETALLYDEKASSPSDKSRVALVIAHELGHQWFGDLVTMDWWDDLWLNEGFATYLEHVGTDVISDNKFGKDVEFVSGSVSTAMQLDELWTSHPIFVPVSSPDDINGIFDSISYHKGGSIIRMLNYTITEHLLRKGLQIYLTKHKYGSANHNDLWEAFTEAVQRDEGKFIKDWNRQKLNVTEFMNPWVVQMGFPVLNVTRRYGASSKTATIDQKHFLLTDKVPTNARKEFLTSPYNFTWYVPVWYQNQNAPGIQSAWLEPKEPLTIYTGSDEQWLLVNYERAVFARVNYDEKNWRLLVKQLTTDHTKIHVKNRIQLLDDSSELSRAGQLPYEVTMNMTLYLHKEENYNCWGTAMDSLSFIAKMFSSTDSYEDFKDYLAAIIQPLFKRLGWDDTKEPVDEVQIHNLRALAIGQECWLGMEDCTSAAQKEFDKFVAACSGLGAMSSKCSPILPNLRKSVYCQGTKQGNDTKAWNLLWSLHANEQNSGEKQRLIYGLSCTKNQALIYQLLNEAISENSTLIRRQDGPTVFGLLGSNDVAFPLIWPFIEDNWEPIKKLYASGMLGLDGILAAGSSIFNTDDKLKLVRKFYEDHESELGSAKRAFGQNLEIIQTNVEWLNANNQEIKDWLKKQPLPIPTRNRNQASGVAETKGDSD